jgi:hypothetical protein
LESYWSWSFHYWEGHCASVLFGRYGLVKLFGGWMVAPVEKEVDKKRLIPRLKTLREKSNTTHTPSKKEKDEKEKKKEKKSGSY